MGSGVSFPPFRKLLSFEEMKNMQGKLLKAPCFDPLQHDLEQVKNWPFDGLYIGPDFKQVVPDFGLLSAITSKHPHLRDLRIVIKTNEEECSWLKMFVSLLRSRHCTLVAMDITGSWLQGPAIELLAKGLAGNASLQSLVAASCGISDFGAEYLGLGLSQGVSHLIQLNLQQNNIGDWGMLQIAKGVAVLRIAWLDVSQNKFREVGAQALANAVKRKRCLQYLNVSGMRSDLHATCLLAILPRLPLVQANFDQMRFTEAGVTMLAQVWTNTLRKTLRYLDLSGVIPCEPLRELFLNLHCTRIEVLSVHHTNSVRAGFSGLIDSISKSQVECLMLTACRLTEDFLLCFLKEVPRSQLQRMDFAYNTFSKRVLQEMARLITRVPLKFLSLFSSYVSDDGMRLLAKSLPAARIRTLDLGGLHGVSDSTWAVFGEKLAGSSIEILNLQGNQIGDGAMEGFGTGVAKSNLKSLLLNTNRIRHGIEFLAKACKECPSLRILELNKNLHGDDDAKKSIKHFCQSNLEVLGLASQEMTLDGWITLLPYLQRFKDTGMPDSPVIGDIWNHSRKVRTLSVISFPSTIPRLLSKSLLTNFPPDLIRILATMLFNNDIESFLN